MRGRRRRRRRTRRRKLPNVTSRDSLGLASLLKRPATSRPKMLLIAPTDGSGTLKMQKWRLRRLGMSFLPPPSRGLNTRSLFAQLEPYLTHKNSLHTLNTPLKRATEPLHAPVSHKKRSS